MTVPAPNRLQLLPQILRQRLARILLQPRHLIPQLLKSRADLFGHKGFDRVPEMVLGHKMFGPVAVQTFRPDRAQLLEKTQALADGAPADFQFATNLPGLDRLWGYKDRAVDQADRFGKAEDGAEVDAEVED